MSGVQKSGYLDVKQPSNIKGRKLKTWKQKWVVVQEMSNLASGTFAAKVDLYHSEAISKQANTDKQTFLLENVTSIEHSHSRTHPLAFEIVETTPVLVFSATSQKETELWISYLKRIFLSKHRSKDNFGITVIENLDAKKFCLSGDYRFTVSPEAITIRREADDQNMGWRLETLKRFYMERDKPNVIIIESGAKAECREARFEFHSENVNQILQAIHRNIRLAMQNRKRRHDSLASAGSKDRSSSVGSYERGFQMILDGSGQRSRTSSIENKGVMETASDKSSNSSRTESVIDNKGSMWQERQGNGNKKATDEKSTESLSSLTTVSGKNDKASDECCDKPEHPYATVHKLAYENETNRERSFTQSTDKSLNPIPSKVPSIRKSKSSPEMIHEYDVLDIGKRAIDDNQGIIDAVSKVIVKTEKDKELEIIIDSHGYSHIPVKRNDENIVSDTISSGPSTATGQEVIRIDSSKCEIEMKTPPDLPPKTKLGVLDFLPFGFNESQTTGTDAINIDFENKARTSSNQSDNHRSTSVGSHDSGVSFMHTDLQQMDEENEYVPANISASVNDAIIVTERQMKWPLMKRCNSNPPNETLDDSILKTRFLKTHERSSSEPVGYETCESEYEELDKYRKDLNKFLGMNPSTPPPLPPSLPERPSTLPPARKRISKEKEKPKKKVSFPLLSITKLRSSSASSGSESEDGLTGQPVAKLQAWPMGSKDNKNNLYETVDSQTPDCESPVSSGNVLSPVSPVNQWPLKTSSQAKCNRFYESSDINVSKVPKTQSDINEMSPDTTQISSNENFVSQSTDLLTGDDIYVPPSDILRPQTTDSLVEQTTDLLGDIPETIAPISDPPLIPGLDVLLPFTGLAEIKTSSNSVSNEYQNISMTPNENDDNEKPVRRTRRKGVVDEPFPNLARYSNPLEEMVGDTPLEIEPEGKGQNSDVGANDIISQNDLVDLSNTSSGDPFDIFHIGILPGALNLQGNQTDISKGNLLVDLHEDASNNVLLGDNFSTTGNVNKNEGECEYMEMNKVNYENCSVSKTS